MTTYALNGLGRIGKLALRPLLESKSLELWTHLLMDLTTAQDLLPRED